MNDKKRILILLKILDQIQQDIENARNGIEKSIAKIFKKEGLSFEQVFCILLFAAVFISNKSFFSFLEQRIHSRSTDNSLNSLPAVICNDM